MKQRLSKIAAGITIAAAMVLTTTVGLTSALAAGGLPEAPPPPTCGMASQPECPSAADLDFYYSIGGIVQGEYLFAPATLWEMTRASDPHASFHVEASWPKGSGVSGKIHQRAVVSANGTPEVQTISGLVPFFSAPIYFEFYRLLRRDKHAAKGTVPYVSQGKTFAFPGLVTSVQARSLAGWPGCPEFGVAVCTKGWWSP